MKSIFNIYKTDVWHTHASRELIGASGSLEGAISLIEQFCTKEGEQFSEHDLYLLRTIQQTQDHEGDGEFIIEKVTLDELL